MRSTLFSTVCWRLLSLILPRAPAFLSVILAHQQATQLFVAKDLRKGIVGSAPDVLFSHGAIARLQVR